MARDKAEQITLLRKSNIYRALFEYYAYINKILKTTLKCRYCNYLILQMRKLRHREVNLLKVTQLLKMVKLGFEPSQSCSPVLPLHFPVKTRADHEGLWKSC